MPAASRNMLSSAIVSSTGSQRRLTYGTIPSKPTDFDTWNIILICLRFEVKYIEYDWYIDIAWYCQRTTNRKAIHEDAGCPTGLLLAACSTRLAIAGGDRRSACQHCAWRLAMSNWHSATTTRLQPRSIRTIRNNVEAQSHCWSRQWWEHMYTIYTAPAIY